MKCELCGKDPHLLFILPIQQVNGKLYTFACEECAGVSSTFCLVHNKIHEGFSDGSSACLKCVVEMVEERKSEAITIWESILKNLSPIEKEWLSTAYELNSLLTGDGEEISILRFIVCKALRTNRTLESVLEEIREDRSVKSILL